MIFQLKYRKRRYHVRILFDYGSAHYELTAPSPHAATAMAIDIYRTRHPRTRKIVEDISVWVMHDPE